MDEVTPLPRRARLTRLHVAVVGLAFAFAGLAALVVGGRLSGLDHHALTHWMPGFDASRATHTIPSVRSLVVPLSLGTPWWDKALAVLTYPASVLISLLVFAAAYAVLVRRGMRTAARVWAAVWVVANVLEVGAKVALEKPALIVERDGAPFHVVPFDHSFPSGHMMRAVLVAAVVGFVWKRGAWPAAAWVLLVPVCLIVTAAHVPSDVAGGLVFGLLVVLATYAVLDTAR